MNNFYNSFRCLSERPRHPKTPEATGLTGIYGALAENVTQFKKMALIVAFCSSAGGSEILFVIAERWVIGSQTGRGADAHTDHIPIGARVGCGE